MRETFPTLPLYLTECELSVIAKTRLVFPIYLYRYYPRLSILESAYFIAERPEHQSPYTFF